LISGDLEGGRFCSTPRCFVVSLEELLGRDRTLRVLFSDCNTDMTKSKLK
jgi:hypothetical protein